jgi:hypothetical protein
MATLLVLGTFLWLKIDPTEQLSPVMVMSPAPLTIATGAQS